MFSLHFYGISRLPWDYQWAFAVRGRECHLQDDLPQFNTPLFLQTNLKGYKYIFTELCKYNMNIMRIGIFTKFTKCINMYNLRAQNRTENKSLLSSNLNTKTDSFWNLVNRVTPIYIQIPSGRCSGPNISQLKNSLYMIFLLVQVRAKTFINVIIDQMLLDISKPHWVFR